MQRICRWHKMNNKTKRINYVKVLGCYIEELMINDQMKRDRKQGKDGQENLADN